MAVGVHDSSASNIDIDDVAGAIRHNMTTLVQELVNVTKIPYYTTAMGKGALDEQQPRWGGFYGGFVSKEDCKAAVEGAECVLWIGNYPVCVVKLTTVAKLT